MWSFEYHQLPAYIQILAMDDFTNEINKGTVKQFRRYGHNIVAMSNDVNDVMDIISYIQYRHRDVDYVNEFNKKGYICNVNDVDSILE